MRSQFNACLFSMLVTYVFTGCANLQRSSNSVKNAKPQVASVEAVATTPPAEKVAISGHVVNCRNGNDVRVLHAEPRGTGCQMMYTKGGRKSVVANAATGLDHCESVLDKIRSKLESSNFTCE